MENTQEHDPLTRLRAQLTALGRSSGARASAVTFSDTSGSGAFPSFWPEGSVHDLYAATPADAVAVNAFGLGAGFQTARDRTVVWGLHDMMGLEAGRPYGPGLQEMGLLPSHLLLVCARDLPSLLTIGEEALRTPTVGAVLLSAWGDGRAMSLTASRRLALAARSHGSTLFLARAGADPAPSAADSRWSVRAEASRPLEAGAPGAPTFSATLLKQRGGGAPRTWIMEWNRDERSFRKPTPISRPVVPVAGQRPAAARQDPQRRVA